MLSSDTVDIGLLNVGLLIVDSSRPISHSLAITSAGLAEMLTYLDLANNSLAVVVQQKFSSLALAYFCIMS